MQLSLFCSSPPGEWRLKPWNFFSSAPPMSDHPFLFKSGLLSFLLHNLLIFLLLVSSPPLGLLLPCLSLSLSLWFDLLSFLFPFHTPHPPPNRPPFYILYFKRINSKQAMVEQRHLVPPAVMSWDELLPASQPGGWTLSGLRVKKESWSTWSTSVRFFSLRFSFPASTRLIPYVRHQTGPAIREAWWAAPSPPCSHIYCLLLPSSNAKSSPADICAALRMPAVNSFGFAPTKIQSAHCCCTRSISLLPLDAEQSSQRAAKVMHKTQDWD